MRAALYHRVSTLEQDPTLAQEELRRVARAMGATIVLDVEETGSGVKKDRPGMLQVLDAASRRQIDVVIVWKLDRWGRSALDVLTNIERLTSFGVRFIATSQGIDLKADGDAMSRFAVQMLAAVAEFERDLIRERTRAGVRKAKARGVRFGNQPLKPEDLPPMDRVAQLLGAGMSLAAVARELSTTVHRVRFVVDRVAAMRAQKMSLAVIANELKVSVADVRLVLMEAKDRQARLAKVQERRGLRRGRGTENGAASPTESGLASWRA